MIKKSEYNIDLKLLHEAIYQLPEIDFKLAINQPSGRFFYDFWTIKNEYKNTVWEILYNSLPIPKGEARIIILDPAHCYQIHADIDDRYHLNILGEQCYLMDLVKEKMYLLEQDGIWYDMDAGFLHTATNFGRYSRVQLVVRKLLKNNKLKNPIEINLSTTITNADDARFVFDNKLSPWFNFANKSGFINNFSHSPMIIKFNIEKDKIDSLKQALTAEFKIL
jgi:hypothetical protein